jgi:diguanylate cyclase (GGDEF)-like protein/PAS domain S-box-containing protein
MATLSPGNEAARLEALGEYSILDTPHEKAFDDLARLARQICSTPIALVSLVDGERQWFKSNLGLDIRETSRAHSFCAHAIEGEDILEVEDTVKDPRFSENPLVTAGPKMRFYAGMPLRTAKGYAIGTLSVIDEVPRKLTAEQREALRILASQVVAQLELRRNALMRERALRDAVQASNRAHEESEKRYRELFERNLAGVYRSTLDGRLLECNLAFARILGYDSVAEVMSRSTWDFYFTREERADAMNSLQQRRELANFELRLRRKDGTAVWVLENELLRQEPGKAAIIEGTIVDVTDRKVAEERIQYQALHDLLTDLPNRLLFADRLTLSIAHARRRGQQLAVFYLNFDHFKRINETMGQTAGDDLLRSIAFRLRSAIRQDDTVARMGGDEFAVLVNDIQDAEVAAKVARKLLDSFREPHLVHGREMFVTASLGIALFPSDGDDTETLVRSADNAMCRGKELGRDTFQFHTAAIQTRTAERLDLENELRRALDRGEFFLEYQPQICLATGGIVAVEALLRWRHPQRGTMPPNSFIPIAEQIGAILPIGEWVLRSAAAQVVEWSRSGLPPVRLAVNLSARQFQHASLHQLIERVLRETGLEPERLELEITESLAMADADYSRTVLEECRLLGVSLAIDDFGTGYSSLSYLKVLPIQTLKVDQTFIRGIALDATDLAIVRSMIEMAHSLGLTVVAEGVELDEQRRVLEELQCDDMQGFLISRPLEAAAMARLLATDR